MSYNGYANYETWNVGLWIDNEEGLQSTVHEMAREANGDVSDLANALKEFVEEMTPDLGSTMFADLLNSALSEVDWYELAEGYLSEVKADA